MKAINKASQILAIVFSAAAAVMFFLPYYVHATGAVNGQDYSFIGGQLAFGMDIEGIGELYKSAKVFLCLILSAAAVVFSALTFKFKQMRYVAPAVALGGAIYSLVRMLTGIGNFIDSRPLGGSNIGLGSSQLEFTVIAWLVPVMLFLAAAAGIGHLLVDDRLMVLAGKAKKTIPQRLVQFLRDYKSEVKKIVWPGWRDVLKNTFIVLVVCALIGVIIWAADLGLVKLLELFSSLSGK